VRLAKLLSTLLVTVTGTPAVAEAATWSPPVDVSGPSTFVDDPFIDFDRSGFGLATWTWQDGVGADAAAGVRLSSRAPTSAFSPERDAPGVLVVPLLYGDNQVALVAEDGIRRRRPVSHIQVAFGRTDGRIRKPRTVDVVETFRAPAAAVNEVGQIALAYIQVSGGRRVAKMVVKRGSRLYRPRVVSPRGVNAVTVAVGSGGDLVIAWEREGRIEARIRRRGRRLGRLVRVGRGAKLGTHLRAAVTPGGRAWITWTSQSQSEGGDAGPFSIQTAVSVTGRGVFHRPVLLDRFDRTASDEATFDLALDARKNGFVAWSSFDGNTFRARLARARSTGRFTSFETLSQAGYDAAVGDLDTSPGGDVLVVWSRLDAVGEVGTSVFAGYLHGGDNYAGEEQVSLGDRAREPAVAFDPRSGLPVVVWSQREGPDAPSVPLAQVRTFLRASTRSP
jgi:hypothetical protein